MFLLTPVLWNNGTMIIFLQTILFTLTAEASYEQLEIDLAQHCEMYDFWGDEQADVPEPEKNNGIMDELRDWVSGSHLPHVLVNQLSILMCHFRNLPKDVGSLLKTCQILNIANTAGGYYHFGLQNGVREQIRICNMLSSLDVFHVQINVNGLPLFKGSNHTLWPIIGLQEEDTATQLFVMGIW